MERSKIHMLKTQKPISRKQIKGNVKAQEAVKKEWKRLWEKGVFGIDIREWSDVAREARTMNKEVHMGIVFGIMVLKGAELPDDEWGKRKKYK